MQILELVGIFFPLPSPNETVIVLLATRKESKNEMAGNRRGYMETGKRMYH